MARQTIELGTLTIPQSGTNSNVISNKTVMSGTITVTFYSPATYTGVVTILVGPDENMAIANMIPAASTAGTNITLTAGKCQTINLGAIKSLAIQSAGAEAAARAVPVLVQIEI